jgi:hypothetical protein
MIKKVYLKPETELSEGDLDQQIMATSITSTGLGDNDSDNLIYDADNSDSDIWGGAW